jgi:hypothetical protein
MVDGFEQGIDLPWGPYGERYTEYDDSFSVLTLEMAGAEVVDTTESGWPTVVVGHQDGTTVGVAIGHVTQLNDKPVEEIDVFVDDERNRWALVEFADLEAALSGGRYGVRGYEGYEVLPIERCSEGFSLFGAYADDRTTPIFEMEDDAAAFAIQRAPDFGALDAMFRLAEYSGIDERRRTLERHVLPRDEWLDRNELTDIARDLPEDG